MLGLGGYAGGHQAGLWTSAGRRVGLAIQFRSSTKVTCNLASVRSVEPVIRCCAVISRYESVRQSAIERISVAWGAPWLQSAPLEFLASGYYTPTMGNDLKKVLVAFEGYQDPAELADWKRHTNRWESELAASGNVAEIRPVNLDPGYVTQAKLVLATTKDRDHRIYLRSGIFAEVTLTYVRRHWTHHRWTYPSYRTEVVAEFAMECRERLRHHLRGTAKFRR